MALKINEANAIGRLKEQVINRYYLLDFRIFGSKSRGDDTLYSDIDVMIELEDSNFEIESEIFDIVFDINLEYDCFISVLIFSRGELEQGPMSESPIYKTIMREGVAV